MNRKKKDEMKLVRLAIILSSVIIVIILAGLVFFLIPGTKTADVVVTTEVAENTTTETQTADETGTTETLEAETSLDASEAVSAEEAVSDTELLTDTQPAEIVTDPAAVVTEPVTEIVTEPVTTVPVTTHDYSNQTVVDQISIVAVGDDLVHKTIFNSYYDANTGTYNFDSIFENVKPTIQAADIAIVNQEVPCAGNNYGITGYPSFNAPTEILDCMVNLGFNVFTTATNHCLDKEYTGLANTLNYLHTYYPGVLTTGTYTSELASQITPIIECRGVKIAVLDYTYGTNGHTVENSWEVNSLYDLNKEAADLARAKQDADFIIVCVHWGTEYSTGVTEEQMNFAQFFADNGADVIIGSHPHVCEPLSTVTAADGRVVPVYYSLGNFLAWQNDWPRPMEGMAKLTLNVWDDGSVTIGSYNMDMMFMHTWGIADGICQFKLYMLRDYDASILPTYNYAVSYIFNYNDMIAFAQTMDPTWTY